MPDRTPIVLLYTHRQGNVSRILFERFASPADALARAATLTGAVAVDERTGTTITAAEGGHAGKA